MSQLHQSTKQVLANWTASKFENNLADVRQYIKDTLNGFIKDPDTGKEGVVDVYIGDYYLR